MLNKWADYFNILISGYFDSYFYLFNYSDCRQSDVDPLWHFVDQGWQEGRNPNSWFDTQYYLQMNPEVKQTGANPFVHYLKQGLREGRVTHPNPAVVNPSTFAENLNSKSITPRNLIYKIGEKIYQIFPYEFRQKILVGAFRFFGFLFKGMPQYDYWKKNRKIRQTYTYYQNFMIDINAVEPANQAVGSIAIHLHIFYLDLLNEFVDYVNNIPYPFDLFVSVVNSKVLDKCQRAFIGISNCQKVKVRKVENRGRDIAAMFCSFGEELSTYDYIAHLHSKKSIYNQGATSGWREYLCQNLFGNPDRIRRIFALLQSNDQFGIIYPQNYTLLPYWANTWLANRGTGEAWCKRLGIEDVPRGYFHYPASSMFWARKEALAPLFKAGFSLDDFPEEKGQTDGTLAHTLERLFVLCALNQGFRPGIIMDYVNPSWSAWRFDQYINRTRQDMVQVLASPEVKLIAFDMFDTLLSRPLLNPESIKEIVARRIGGKEGHLYKKFRPIAEQKAREAKNLDVGLDETYEQLGELAGLPNTKLAEIKQIEVEVEKASLAPREGAISLFREALATNKPVVLMTDMFLPRPTLETILHSYEIAGWEEIYVSNEIGYRKDSGQLYNHVLSRFSLEPSEMVMIGDNERADVQIPIDMGASVIHFMRPVELARGLPRFSSIITAHEDARDIDAELTIGLVVRKNFAPIHFENVDTDSLVPVTPYNLGYSLVGPLLVSFAQWLVEQARTDGIEKYFFLSREGNPIKKIYDYWTRGEHNAPSSEYLIISRRAAGLSAIETIDDILEIAKTTYLSNSIDNFLFTRYGLNLTDKRWREIAKSLNFTRTTTISVQNRQIEQLIPLLTALEEDILSKVKIERMGLIHYLTEKGLNQDSPKAVVDVGYGGSVQGYLNKLLSKKVHGYYMMTDERSKKVAETYQVTLRGCFHEYGPQTTSPPLMVSNSFDLEKLLSTDEPQIEYYEIDSTNNVKGHFRELLPEELASSKIRCQLMNGAMDFAKDAHSIRTTMLPEFKPSCWTAQMLFEAFLGKKSQQEIELLSRIVLDDYYCGRGLVS